MPTARVSKRCRALELGLTDTLPEIAKRPAATRIRMAAGVVERSGRLLLVRVADDAARWAGMWQFPSVELSAGESPEAAARRAVRSQAGLDALPRELVTVVKHGVTRYRITLDAFRCAARGSATPKAGRASLEAAPELAELALPAAHARIAKALA